jgi:hypothetical protein
MNCGAIKLLLRKCSMERVPGSGRRAERIFYRSLRALNATGWRPDAECVYYVVACYLQEHSLSHIRMADRFVRQCIQDFGLLPVQQHAGSTSCTSWRIFDRLLESYSMLAAVNATDESKLIKRADELFRFFLVQHRNGRVVAEEPDEHHLGHLVRLWNRGNDGSTAANTTHEKVAEYYQLMRDLRKRGIIKSCPDGDNDIKSCTV